MLRRVIGAQEAERRRIARDLHDNLGQMLTVLRHDLESLKLACGEQAEVRGIVDRSQRTLGQLDSEVDFLAWELRPAALDQLLGLRAALDNYVREWSVHFGIPAEFQAAGMAEDRLAPEIEINLYRVAQEALNNTYKHAEATRAGVLLERHDGQVMLVIEDDGKGFEPGRATGGERGVGLLSMSERAEQVGGTLEIESELGAGTTLYVRVPACYADTEKANNPD